MPQSSGFHEVRFPTNISFGSSGGPQRSTEIVTLGSGREQRNQRWQRSRRRYDAGYGMKDLDDLHAVIAFYEARRGPFFGFRYRDPLDWKSCPPLQSISANDQRLGTGNGEKSVFSLIKRYGQGDISYQRTIEKPHQSSVVISVDGSLQVPGVDYSLEETTGAVSFSPGAIPQAGAAVTAGFEFDVPVRFALDELTVNLSAFKAGEIPSVPLLEIRP